MQTSAQIYHCVATRIWQMVCQFWFCFAIWVSSLFFKFGSLLLFCMLADLLQLCCQIWNVDDLVIGLFISEFESDGLQNLETLQKSQ
jgi:hypothetical protein